MRENKSIENVGKIAVLRSNSLGDYIFVIPALEALRRAYPRAEIILLGKKWHQQFLDRRPGPVDRVIVVPPLRGINDGPGIKQGSPSEINEFFARVTRERVDIGMQLYGGGRYSNPFIRSIKPRVSVGLKASDAPPLDRWIPYVYYHPEVFRYMEVVALVGARPVSLEPRLAVTLDDIREARQKTGFTDKPIVVLHPGGADPRRRWPPEKFAEVGDALSGSGAHVFLTGTKNESPIIDRILNTMKNKAQGLCGVLSLKGLAGLLSMSCLIVSNDTGPLHLARAVGAASVGIYWVGNLINAGPVTASRHRSHLSWRLECPECGINCIEAKCSHTASFVSDVPAGEVTVSALELLALA